MFVRVIIERPLRSHFDYAIPAHIEPASLIIGQRVLVPFQSKKTVAIVIALVEKSDIPLKKIKPLEAILDETPLFSSQMVTLLLWLCDYYHAPIGEVFFMALPPSLRKPKPALLKLKEIKPKKISLPDYQLNTAQNNAMTAIKNVLGTFSPFVLYGITGSGKTEVYLQVIEAVLHQGGQVLVLVPEIGLTPQMISRFEKRLDVRIGKYHSHMAAGARTQEWLMAKEGITSVMIGTRSSVFMPFKNLQLIIIDEAHDASFKQHEGVRYHARDVAVKRTQLENIPIVMGSATPSLENFYQVNQEKYTLLHLPARTGNSSLPDYELINLRHVTLNKGFAPVVLQAIETQLAKKQQVMIFLNRRGFSPLLLCHDCAWRAECPECERPLTVHKRLNALRCHHCGLSQKIPAQCLRCQSSNLLLMGHGTEKIEESLQILFPRYAITRIDHDTTRRKDALEKKLTLIHEENVQILVGTQMLAKGHHFPEVTLVVVLEADSGLYSSDFRASEQLAQLITQVAGRAGRMDKKGTVMIQTHYPEHPLMTALTQLPYDELASLLLQERARYHLPPFIHFIVLSAESEQGDKALTLLKKFQKYLQEVKVSAGAYTILGPAAAPVEKRAGRYRYQLILSSTKRSLMHEAIKKVLPKIESFVPHDVRWHIDVDPIDLS
jgi:primosomal protein N' (replication factor Y)